MLVIRYVSADYAIISVKGKSIFVTRVDRPLQLGQVIRSSFQGVVLSLFLQIVMA